MLRDPLIIIMLCIGLCSLAVPIICISRFTFAIFSPGLRAKIRKEWGFHIVLVVISIACAWLFIFCLQVGCRVGSATIYAAKIAKRNNEANQIQTALLGYYTEYAEMPPTTDNATLIKILTGNNPRYNPRNIAFISVSPRDLNAKGEMVDAWQQPFRISFAAPDHPVVTSDPPPTR